MHDDVKVQNHFTVWACEAAADGQGLPSPYEMRQARQKEEPICPFVSETKLQVS